MPPKPMSVSVDNTVDAPGAVAFRRGNTDRHGELGGNSAVSPHSTGTVRLLPGNEPVGNYGMPHQAGLVPAFRPFTPRESAFVSKALFAARGRV
jgi:hypothetical protein